jgi:hypothetical protein
MELAFSADQRELFDAFDQFFSKESGPDVVRRAEPLGFDPDLWRRLEAMEVWGSGATLPDLAVIAETVGRAIAPVPFVEHAVASRLLALASGERIATVSLRAATADGTWTLVPAGAIADIVVGLADGAVVVAEATPPMHGPRNHASAPLADRSVQPRGSSTIDDAAFARALAEWRVLTSALLVGVAARALEIGVGYVKERQQFGVPIGSFQAVQHGLADLPGMIDGARLLAHEAAAALEATATDDPRVAGRCDVALNDISDPSALASMAFLFASDVAAHATDRALHFHGGYGFAEEYDIQLYYRRARGWSLILGEPAAEHLALADRLWPAEGGA